MKLKALRGTMILALVPFVWAQGAGANPVSLDGFDLSSTDVPEWTEFSDVFLDELEGTDQPSADDTKSDVKQQAQVDDKADVDQQPPVDDKTDVDQQPPTDDKGDAKQQTPVPNPGQTPPDGNGGGDDDGADAPTTELSDIQILGRVYLSNQLEINASRLLLSKSSASAVRRYANMMVTMHTASNREVFSVARQLGFNAVRTGAVNQAEIEERQQNARRLAEIRGASRVQVNKLYLAFMVESHAKTLEKLRSFQTIADNDAVEALIVKTIPVVEAHLREARALSTSNQ